MIGIGKHRLRVTFGLAFVGTALVGCAVESGEMSEGPLASTQEELAPSTSKLWKQPRHSSTTTLDTCWSMSQTQFDDTSQERQWVRDVINDTWEDEARIDFTGWDRCSSGEDVVIKVKDETAAPHTDGFGTSYGEMVLNFAFTKWDGVGNPTTGASCADTEAKRQDCIETIAVHEFGHLLGFVHENDRDDFTSCSDGSNPGDTGGDNDLLLYNPDPSSIMSYCPEGEWQGNLLSNTDIDMVRRLYGGGGAIQDNHVVALRNHKGRYFRISGSSVDLESSIMSGSTRNLVRIQRSAGSGSVNYGDDITIKSLATGRYLCTSGSSTTTSKSPCAWEVKHTSGNNGGSLVNVNESFELARGSVRFSMDSENDWRFLGPINADLEKTYYPTKNGLRIQAMKSSRIKWCQEQGWATSSGYSSESISGSEVVTHWNSSSGQWVAVTDGSPPIEDFTVYHRIDCSN